MIRVNAVRPDLISTPMLGAQGMGLSDEQFEQFKKSVLNSLPLGRLGTPEEIAKAVAFLACGVVVTMTAVISQALNCSSMGT